MIQNKTLVDLPDFLGYLLSLGPRTAPPSPFDLESEGRVGRG